MIFNIDCIQGIQTYIDDFSIDLIVASPPYKKQDGFSWQLIKDIAQECYRVLKNNSLCYINFGHLAGNKSRPFKVAMEFEERRHAFS
ncbi:hypothetical protein M0Q39_06620 [Patescibacteria group bacterium]|nr:hypothetical protein [Patescibacteria group bacterium]